MSHLSCVPIFAFHMIFLANRRHQYDSEIQMQLNTASITAKDWFLFGLVLLFRTFGKLEGFILPALRSSTSPLCFACPRKCVITGLCLFFCRSVHNLLFFLDFHVPRCCSCVLVLSQILVHLTIFPMGELASKVLRYHAALACSINLLENIIRVYGG